MPNLRCKTDTSYFDQKVTVETPRMTPNNESFLSTGAKMKTKFDNFSYYHPHELGLQKEESKFSKEMLSDSSTSSNKLN